MSVPSELFKYRNFDKYTILSLLNRELWIPNPVQLNDPFDAQIKLTLADISMESFIGAFSCFQEWFKKKHKETITYRDFELLFDNGKPNQHLTEKVQQFQEFWNSKSSKIGILSLSETPKSITMWSHYADNHTGICIGYDPVNLFDKSPAMYQDWLWKVDYRNEEEILRNAFLLYAKCGMWHSNDSAFSLLFRMLSTKSRDWGYESEWRYLTPDNGGKLFNLNIYAITSITFGLRTSVETKTAVSHLLRYWENKTKFYQIIRKPDTVGLMREGLFPDSKYWFETGEEC
jgi:hypothetical protein